MRTYSAHYWGIYGAAIGFAILERFESVNEAIDSGYADHANGTFEKIDTEGVIKLTFRKFNTHE